MSAVGMPDTATAFVEVCSVSDLAPGGQRVVMVGTRRLLVCRDTTPDQRIHAIEDRCSHAIQPLAGGPIRGGHIVCPKHGARFNLATGTSTNAVTPRPIKVHAVEIREGQVFVAVEPRA